MLDKTMLVFGQMNEPPGARMRVALSGLTMAEYFRDAGGQDVLLFIDNIFRFVQAGSEVSALLGRMPSQVGYQPTLETEMGQLQERITSTRKGSVTSVQAIYVPADDLTDPAPASVFAHLNATTTLSRAISEKGIYPAVDPLDSTSTILKPDILGEEHFRGRQRGQGDPAALQGAAGHHRDPRHRRALRRGQADGAARAQDRALPVAAVLRRRAVHRHARASTCRSPRRSAASRRSSRASTTRCPSAPSSQGLDRPGRRRQGGERRRPKDDEAEESDEEAERRGRQRTRGRVTARHGAHEVPGRGPHARGRGLRRRGRDALDAHRRRLDRHARQPHAAAGDARPDRAAAVRVRDRDHALRAGRGLPAGGRQPRARARRGGASRRTTSTRADLQEKLQARPSRTLRAAEEELRGAARRRARQAPLARRSCGSPSRRAASRRHAA